MEKFNLLNDKLITEKELSSLEKVCSKYGVNIKEVKKFKTVYKILTNENTVFCIKRTRGGRKKLVNCYKLLYELNDNNFNQIPIYLKTTKGNLYIKEKKTYTMLDSG